MYGDDKLLKDEIKEQTYEEKNSLFSLDNTPVSTEYMGTKGTIQPRTNGGEFVVYRS